MNKKYIKQQYDKVIAKSDYGQYMYYEQFEGYCRDLLKIIKNARSGKRLFVHIKPSKSGMSRKFYFEKWVNMALNVINNDKASYDYVQSYGYGMDMLWHELYRFCEHIVGSKKAMDELNGKCSHCTYVLG